MARTPVLITTGKGLGICLQKEGGMACFKGVIAGIKGDLQVTNGRFVLTPLMVNEVSINENGSYVIPEYLKTILDVDGNTEIDVDIFENNGSEIYTTGKLKIKANQVAQTVLAQEYLASESYGASQSFFSSKARHEKCYSQKIVMPEMKAGDIDIQTTGKVDLEGLIISERDIKIASGGDVSMASRVFYQTLDYTEKVNTPFTNASVQRFLSNPQIAPNIVRAGGDFILTTLGDYYMTGVHSEIVGNKIVRAKRIVSAPLKVESRDEIISDITNLSMGLPSSVLAASFSMHFSDAGKQLLSQNPMYQAMDSLFGSGSSARKASALVNLGLATHDTLKTISEALLKSSGEFTSGTAMELAAKFFDVGGFGISHTHTHQTSVLRHGVVSVDSIGGNLYYEAETDADFIGHRAKATNTVIIAGRMINVLPDVEENIETVNQQTSSFGVNTITKDIRGGISSMDGSNISEKHHPVIFASSETNTFQAPNINMTNPLLTAQRNIFRGETKLNTLYDVNRGNSSSRSVGLSFSSKTGFAPMASLGVSGSNFINESAPLAGVEGKVEIEGFLRNDSVPISGNITGNYEYSYRRPRNENHGWGVSISGIDLSSTEAFGRTFERAIRSGIVGYAAGRTAQALGAGDFASSLIGSLASAYASASGESRDGLSSLGHISESRNDHELEVEVVGFNRDLFNQELNQIKENIFAEALDEGASIIETVERIDAMSEWAEATVAEAKSEGKSDEEAVAEVRKNAGVAKEIVKIDQEVRKESLAQISAKRTAEVEQNSATIDLLLGQLTQSVASETKYEKAMRTYLTLKMLECSSQPTQENLTTLSKAIKVAKRTAIKVFDGIFSLIGPQTAEAMPAAAAPAIEIALVRVALWLSENPQAVQNVIATTSGLLNLGQILEKRRHESGRNTGLQSSNQMSSAGGNPNLEPEDPKEPKKSRIQRTAEDVVNYFKNLRKNSEWKFYKTDGKGHKAYRNSRTGEIRYNDDTHHEIECFDTSRRHSVLDPVTGERLNKPAHQFPDWLKK